MINDPFSLLQPFAKKLEVNFCTKEDAIDSDDALKKEIGKTKIVSLWQEHGSNIIAVDHPTERTEKADGVITQTKDLTLTIRIADCQAFLIYEPQKNVVGLLHAGWRGLVKGAIPNFFQKLEEAFQISGEECFVCAAESLCQKCSEFTDPKKELPEVDQKFFHDRCVDLRGIAEDQLLKAGMKRENFERREGCTRCSPRTYWTYRGGDREAVLRGSTNVLSCMLL